MPPATSAPSVPDASLLQASATPTPAVEVTRLDVTEVPSSAPIAEPGDSTSEYRLVKGTTGLIITATGLLDAAAGSNLIHLDPTVVIAANGFSAALVTFLGAAYTFARSLRKRGTQG